MSGSCLVSKLAAALAVSGCVGLIVLGTPAHAQTDTQPPVPSHAPGKLVVPRTASPMTAANAAPGVLDYDGIPTVEGASAANVAGLMAYCYGHNLTTDTTVRVLGRKLARKPGVSTNPAYAWGGVGRLMLDKNTMFDVTTLKPRLQAAVCSRSALRGPDLLNTQ
ncbi:MAG: hypothetical protein ABF628_02375 [Acetobacter orientalis]|uniref:hypothetical protein n=1 Tax=Acetobacter orientalis TaxID=146474 RepID=UPI0039E8D251